MEQLVWHRVRQRRQAGRQQLLGRRQLMGRRQFRRQLEKRRGRQLLGRVGGSQVTRHSPLAAAVAQEELRQVAEATEAGLLRPASSGQQGLG